MIFASDWPAFHAERTGAHRLIGDGTGRRIAMAS
jgi:hypothetical protein